MGNEHDIALLAMGIITDEEIIQRLCEVMRDEEFKHKMVQWLAEYNDLNL